MNAWWGEGGSTQGWPTLLEGWVQEGAGIEEGLDGVVQRGRLTEGVQVTVVVEVGAEKGDELVFDEVTAEFEGRLAVVAGE